MTERRLRAEIRDGLFQFVDDEAGAPFEVVEDVDAPAFVEFLIDRIQRFG